MRLFQHQKIVLIVYLTSLTCGCCRLHGALVGLSTSVPCEGIRFSDNKKEPPFWIINATVYELFSIPRHFPFISVITRFPSLYIPLVSTVLNNTTFQCARLGANTVENGTIYQLQVPGNNEEDGIIFEDIAELVLNYQELYIRDNRVTVSWVLNDTCSERFQVQGYTLDTGEPVLSPEHVFDVGTSTSVVLPLDSNISYRLVAFGENASLCSSNQDIFYRFQGVLNVSSFTLNFSSCISFPPTTFCLGGSFNFLWPARAGGRSCVCPVYNSSAGRRVFESCVEGCRDAVLTPTLTEEGHICIANSSSHIGELFHFVCSSDVCDGDMPCFSQAVLSSHNIIAAGHFDSYRSIAAFTTEIPSVNASCSSIAATVIIPLLVMILLILLTVNFIQCYCYHQKKTSSETGDSSSSAMPSLAVTSGPAPVYEEIQELSQDVGTQGSTEQTPREVYKFTTCPAYTHN